MFYILIAILFIAFCVKGIRSSSKKDASPKAEHFEDPVERAMDHFENDPEKLDLEDQFWIDEIMDK